MSALHELCDRSDCTGRCGYGILNYDFTGLDKELQPNTPLAFIASLDELVKDGKATRNLEGHTMVYRKVT